MADAIRFVLTNLPALLFISAVFIAFITRSPASKAHRYLAWLLLLSVGVEGVWAGAFHVFFPETAASYIGWQDSPFQFEIGVADMAIGITAIVSFWRSLDFKTAVVCYIVLFYIGVAIGHVHQAMLANNFEPGNFGVLLLLTLAKVVILTGLAIAANREAAGSVAPMSAR